MAGSGDSGGVRWRVFVSHTSELRDFPAGGSYVAAVERAISACAHVVVDMADFPATDLPAAVLCRERVRSCDVYVGVLGTRYGSAVPDMPEVSYTELEFDAATEADLPRLVFMLDTNAAQTGIPPSHLIDSESGARQEAFRRRVRDSGLVTQPFADPAALGQLVERSLRELAARRARTVTPATAGRLLAEVTDPFDLEVHRPVQPGDRRPGLPVLPPYVARDHDHELAGIVRAAAKGTSGIAVLVGGSSTGKTRACWEALGLLRKLPEEWRLWHPIDPSRPGAALRELGSIGPRTVVWLNEAQFYLDAPAGALGERVAAGLRELLRDPGRGPVLVLATLWPQFWGILTARPPAGEDPHAQARDLLSGRDVPVPAAFTPEQMRQLTHSGDPRLALAAAAADGQVIQFLAGAPELLARYEYAPPAAKALISAAIDARRLGMGLALTRAFLEAAAPGYLTDTDWDGLGEDWLDQALAYTAADCKGVRGPLTRIRPRPADKTVEPGYRLADYLDQHGRPARRAIIPPAAFWDAAVRFAGPGDLPALADAAENRGLLRDAARLRKQATLLGDPDEIDTLIRDLHSLHPGDRGPARWAAAHAALDKPRSVAYLLDTLQRMGADEQAAALLARDPASHAALDDVSDVAQLLDVLREAGADEQARVLAGRAAAHAALEDAFAVARLLDALREAGADEQARVLAGRAAAHEQARVLAARAAVRVALNKPNDSVVPLNKLQATSAEGQTAALRLQEPAPHATLDNPAAVARLLDALREADEDEQARDVARRAAAHAALNRFSSAELLNRLREAAASEQVVLLERRPAALDNPFTVAGLLDMLREAGADEQARVLAEGAATYAALDDLFVVAQLLDVLREAGAGEQAKVLAGRAAAHAALEDAFAVARLLDALREAGAEEQAAALLARDPAAHTSLDNPDGIARLLYTLRGADEQEQAAALLARDPAAHTSLDDAPAVGRLLDALQEAGAEEQFLALADRMPAEGLFHMFCTRANNFTLYKFGREPDGTPAPPWDWAYLD